MAEKQERVLPDWAHDDQRDVVWLDDDHAVTWTAWPGEEEPSGGVLWHRKAAGQWCAGAWYLREPLWKGESLAIVHDTWTLESREPLTLAPSFRCHCGHHGWIRAGTWVSA